MGAEVQEPDVGEGRRARFERSRVGQTVITYALLVALAALVVQNLPSSVVKRDLGVVERGAHRLGYEQDWSVFAPDPRAENFRVYAMLTYPGGSTERWDVPKGSPWWDAYNDYRWQKYQERLRLDDYAELRRPLARWLVATHTRGGQHPVKVVLTRRVQIVIPIDNPSPQPNRWVTQDFFTYQPERR